MARNPDTEMKRKQASEEYGAWLLRAGLHLPWPALQQASGWVSWGSEESRKSNSDPWLEETKLVDKVGPGIIPALHGTACVQMLAVRSLLPNHGGADRTDVFILFIKSILAVTPGSV